MGAAPVTITRTRPPRDSYSQDSAGLHSGTSCLDHMTCVWSNRRRTCTLWKMSLSHMLLFLMMPSLTSAYFLSTAKFSSHFLKGVLAPLCTCVTGLVFTAMEGAGSWCLKQSERKEGAADANHSLCHRRGWEVEGLLGKWWAAGFSCHLAAVWCHPGRIPPLPRHCTSLSTGRTRKSLKTPQNKSNDVTSVASGAHLYDSLEHVC